MGPSTLNLLKLTSVVDEGSGLRRVADGAVKWAILVLQVVSLEVAWMPYLYSYLNPLLVPNSH